MDLILLLAALYAWECLTTVPSQTVILIRGLRRVRAVHGGGLRFLNPWPSALSVPSMWFPLRVDREEICTAVPTGRTGVSHSGADRRCVPVGPSSRIDVSGTLLKIDRVPFIRVPTPAHAQWASDLCIRLAGTDPEDRPRIWRAALRQSLGQTVARNRVEDARQRTKWLAPLCDASVLLVFGLAPAAILLLGEELALRALAPAFLILHLVTVVALHYSLEDSGPPDASAPWERVVVAFLYPPSLWRAPQMIYSDALVGLQPATVAAQLLDRAEFAEFARRRLAVLDACRAYCDPQEGCTDGELEREELLRMMRAQDSTLEGLQFAPQPEPGAQSVCPICQAGYVYSATICVDCGAVTHPSVAVSSPGSHER